MVGAVGGENSQLFVNVLSEGGNAQVAQTWSTVLINFPAEDSQSSQIFSNVLIESSLAAQVSQLFTVAVVRGRVANPTLRVWTFVLDGHTFYVLRLGDSSTFIYDVYSKQWMDWADLGSNSWRATSGVNWTGGQKLAQNNGSNVVVGDDTFGLLWFLDPDQPYDQHPIEDNPTQEIYFDRITMGQVPMVGREVMPCYVTWLTSDMGGPAYEGAAVRLSISDDAGVIFNDMGDVIVTQDVNSPQLAWYSLGQIVAPGRLFRIWDDGAVARIDTLEMNDPDDEDGD